MAVGEADRELGAVLEKVYRRLVREALTRRAERAGKGRVEPGDEHGIYLYEAGVGWRLLRREGEAFRLGELGDGVYVVYFDNSRCPACRFYDRFWFPFVERHAGEAFFVIVLCEWFTRRCDSEAARKSFAAYRVKASPTTVFARVEDGLPVDMARLEGARTDYELEQYLKQFKPTTPER